MKIERTISNNGNILPSVYNLLKCLPDSVLHHKEHGLRHPLGIYNVSIAKINDNFNEVLINLHKIKEHKIQDPDSKYDDSSILNTQEKLLYSLQAHIDDCYLILKSIHPKIETKKEIKFTDQWLEHAKHPSIHEFKEKTSTYRKKLGSVVNKIKHEHNRLRSFAFYKTEIFALGYFVESASNDEYLGPNPQIHQGGDTGFSFNRDLKYHFYHLYEVSERLKNAIIKAIQEVYALEISETKSSNDNNHWEELAKQISELPYRFFPDEILKPIPGISFLDSDDEKKLVLEYPCKQAITLPLKMKITVFFKGDGVTRKYLMPYFKPRKYEKESLY